MLHHKMASFFKRALMILALTFAPPQMGWSTSAGTPAEDGETGAAPAVSEIITPHDTVISQTPEDPIRVFQAYVGRLRIFTTDRFTDNTDPEKDFQLKVNFLHTHRDGARYVTNFRDFLAPSEETRRPFVDMINLVELGYGLGTSLTTFTKDLFKLFTDENIGRWDHGFITHVPGQDRKSEVRIMMALIQNMTMQAYFTFQELLVRIKPHENLTPAEDYDFQKARLGALEAFADNLHFNKHLMQTHQENPGLSETYMTFMSSLLKEIPEGYIAFTGHDLHQTNATTEISDEERLKRLSTKATLLEKKTLPMLSLAQMWFGQVGPACVARANEIAGPINRGEAEEGAGDEHAKWQTLQEAYLHNAKTFTGYHAALTERLPQIIAEHDTLQTKISAEKASSESGADAADAGKKSEGE